MSHAPDAVVMVRPHAFRVNAQTAADNAFQGEAEGDIAEAAYAEVTAMAKGLRRAGVRVHLFEDEDEGDGTPDSVFPNNWFSTHRSGALVTYPMRAENRRAERREDILTALAANYVVERRIDLSAYEQDGRFLEGTGSIVFDRSRRTAFACRSGRTDEKLLGELCGALGYSADVFEAVDGAGRAIYHTNVVMALGTGYALVGMDCIEDAADRQRLTHALADDEIIELTPDQIAQFAGNAFEIRGKQGLLLAMSTRAMQALTPSQEKQLGRFAQLVAFDVPTIELAGGSVRCMLAGVHLPRRTGRSDAT